MRTVAISFTNFGPYHIARLRALAKALEPSGSRLIAYETAATEAMYPWQTQHDRESFDWVTLFPDRVLEQISGKECIQAMGRALHRDHPDLLGVVGYVRPESLAMLRWARGHGIPTVLMSESQAIDRPRVWWKEAVKRRRVRHFSAGLVGGPRHRDYLVSLGMSKERIALGYNAVDAEAFASAAENYRRETGGRLGLPEKPYFLAVSRFAKEKNIVRLVEAYTRYRREIGALSAWDLVLCGDGPEAAAIENAVVSSGFASSIHRPGFLQQSALSRWYAFASAFVHPSLMEPWGLVVNEAAACGLPLLVSDRAGCVETFVPEAPGDVFTGRRLDGRDAGLMATSLRWVSMLPEVERSAMGEAAAKIARAWGPERFAQGALEAFQIALGVERQSAPGRREFASVH